MDWSAPSRDMNQMENMWTQLTRDVYANRRQFATD